MADIRYEAFISYRHLPADTAAALQIEKALENYKIPHALRKKAGRSRLQKCFRDRDELPLSDDLGESIDAALTGSRWLIVICTPELPKSKWCLREIDRFIEMGRRDRIIPVLLQGEPEESYPRQLRVVERDGKQVDVEPLSADLRTPLKKGVGKLLRVEKLRIIARMLGVGFDELRRRQRERRLRLALSLSAGVAALLALFLAYAFVQNARINEQRVLAATNESSLLIEKSLLYIQQDRRAEARQLALEAYDVSKTIEGINRKEALDALAAASYAGDFSTSAVLKNTGIILHSQVFSPDDRFVTCAAGRTNVMCFAADTGMALWSAALEGTGISTLSYSPDGSKILVLNKSADRAYVLSAADGALLYTSEFGVSDGTAYFLDNENVVLVRTGEVLQWNLPEGSTVSLFDFGTVEWPQACNASIAGAPGLIAWLSHDGSGKLVIGDLHTKKLTLYQTGVEHGIWSVGFSAEQDALAVNLAGVLCVIDLSSGELRWTQTVANDMNSAPYWLENGLILFAGTAYDAATGQLVFVLGNGTFSGAEGTYYENVIMDALIVPGGEYVIVDGAYYWTDTGEKICQLPGGKQVFAVSHRGDTLLVGSTGADFTLVYALGKGTQRFEPAYTGKLYRSRSWSPLKGSENGMIMLMEDPTYQAVNSYLMQQMFVSPDGRFAVMVNKYDYIAVYDMDLGLEVAFRIYGQSAGIRDAAFTEDSRLIAMSGDTGMVTVYDLPDRRTVQTMTDDYGMQSLYKITFNPRGDLVMVQNHNGTQYLVYAVQNGALLYRMHALGEAADFGFDMATGNAVVLYRDGSATVAQIFGDEEKLLAASAGE